MCVAKCDAYDVFQLEHELRVSQEKSAVMCDDRSKFEESVKVVQQSNSMAQAQLSQLQVLHGTRALSPHAQPSLLHVALLRNASCHCGIHVLLPV